MSSVLPTAVAAPPQAPECAAEEIKSYPTWIYRGERIYGIQTLEELAQLTDFEFSSPNNPPEIVGLADR